LGSRIDNLDCLASKFVGFLVQNDFIQFVEAFSNATTDIRLFDSGPPCTSLNIKPEA
jgi:hypothetical protein